MFSCNVMLDQVYVILLMLQVSSSGLYYIMIQSNHFMYG